jgi:hypothetical protein
MCGAEDEDLAVNAVIDTATVDTATVDTATVDTAVVEEPVATVIEQLVTETVRERIYKAALARSQQSKPSDS